MGDVEGVSDRCSDKFVGGRDDGAQIAALQVLVYQRSCDRQDVGLDDVTHENPVPFHQLGSRGGGKQAQHEFGCFLGSQVARVVTLHQFVVETLSFKDRKSTRLNSSHVKISYAVFCLKKKI